MKAKNIKKTLLILAIGWLAALSAIGQPQTDQSQVLPKDVVERAKIECAFSPEAGALDLVLKAIDSATQSIRLSGYSFTSPRVVGALVKAKRRGVDVEVVVDYKENISMDRSGKAKAALNLLVNAGIPTRTISVYKIHHDKFMIIDGKTVETGSFNYTAAASYYNSENVVLIWDDPNLAKEYLDHWQTRFDQGQDYQSAY